MKINGTATGAHEPILHCPNCNHEIKLTESLAAPLLEETRRRFQEQLAQKDAEVARQTDALRREQKELVSAREQIEEQVTQRLEAERIHLVAAEAKKAKTKTVTGCVEASNNQYDLSTVTAKKGKPRHYALTGSQNFATEVGHRVRVTGLFGKSTVKVAKMEQLATSCH